jgi:hypothetical protein
MMMWIVRGSETITKNIKISAKANLGYYQLKKHKPWFNKGNKPNCSGYMIKAK